jgi:hypothetical protein
MLTDSSDNLLARKSPSTVLQCSSKLQTATPPLSQSSCCNRTRLITSHSGAHLGCVTLMSFRILQCRRRHCCGSCRTTRGTPLRSQGRDCIHRCKPSEPVRDWTGLVQYSVRRTVLSEVCIRHLPLHQMPPGLERERERARLGSGAACRLLIPVASADGAHGKSPISPGPPTS